MHYKPFSFELLSARIIDFYFVESTWFVTAKIFDFCLCSKMQFCGKCVRNGNNFNRYYKIDLRKWFNGWKFVSPIDFVHLTTSTDGSKKFNKIYRIQAIYLWNAAYFEVLPNWTLHGMGKKFDRHNFILTTVMRKQFYFIRHEIDTLITTTQFFDRYIIYYNNKYSIPTNSYDETTLYLFNWYCIFKISLKIATVTFSFKENIFVILKEFPSNVLFNRYEKRNHLT